MTAAQIIFLIMGVITLATATMVVTVRNIVHASLWLVATLFSVAILFVLLQANFFAVVEVMVYIGAIAILIIFAIMLTRRVMYDSGPQTNSTWWISALIALGSFTGLVALILSSTWPDRPDVDLGNSVAALGEALVSPGVENAQGVLTPGYLLPFEVVSVMLVLAMIGAIAVALPTVRQKN